MKILVIDGQGGGVGKAVIEHIKKEFKDVEIIAVGTNSLATGSMLKAGATYAATGENAVVYNCQSADVILGSIGIGFANSMHGEISPKMAQAISESSAYKILLPVSKCNVCVLGGVEKPLAQHLVELTERLKRKFDEFRNK